MGGRLMVIFGRRQIFVTGVAIFACGTLGCGLATSMGTMIFARCVAGVGGGIVGPGEMNAKVTPPAAKTTSRFDSLE